MPPARRAKVDAAATSAAGTSTVSSTVTPTLAAPATRKTTRSTAAKTPAPTIAKPTTITVATTGRSRTAAKAKKENDGDGDADDLWKGLTKLSIQPEAPPPTTASAKRTVRKAPTKVSATSKASTTNPAVEKPSARTPVASRKPAAPSKTAASASSTTARSASTAVASSSSKVKGKGKEDETQATVTAFERTLPWAVYDVDHPIKPLNRAKMAMEAVNESSKALSTALAAGYRYRSTSNTDTNKPQSEATAMKSSEDWTDETVENAVETCRIGLKLLRDLKGQGYLPGKALDLERSCQIVITKCVTMGWFSKAMEMNLAARPHLLDLYMPRTSSHEDIPLSTPAQPRKIVSSTASRSTFKGVSVGPAQTISPSSSGSQVRKEWLEMVRMPAPEKKVAELDEHVRSVLFSSMMIAWITLVVLHPDKVEVSQALNAPQSPSVSDSDGFLHPLVLANFVPRASSVTTLHAFYRQITLLTIPTSSPVYLHLRYLSFLSLSFTISPAPDSKATPAQFWDTLHRCLVGFVREDERKEKLKEAAEVADKVVSWVENLVDLRDEKGWFEGKAWLSFVEMWISLGRRLGDSHIIDKPLSLLTSSTSISKSDATAATPSQSKAKAAAISSTLYPSTPPAPAQTPITSISSSSTTSNPSSSTSDRPKIKNPDAEVARICGDLAKASLVLGKGLKSTSLDKPLTSIEGLFSEEIVLLAQAVTSVRHQDDEIPNTAGKAVRAWERVRRGCVKAHDQSSKADHAPIWAQVTGDLRGWLEASLDFAEILVESSILDQALLRDVISGSVDIVICLHRAEYAEALPSLKRFQSFMNVSRIAYNGGAQWYRQSKNEEAAEMTRMSCQWGTEAIELSEQSKGSEGNWQKGIDQVRDSMVKRWELLAGCYQRANKRDEMYNAYAHCLASQPPSTYTKLSENVSTSPLNETYIRLPELDSSLTRLASLILFDPPGFKSHTSELVNTMQDAKLAPEVIGAIVERLLIRLEDMYWKAEGAEICLGLADALLEIYGARYPVRRIRTLAKVMEIITASGKQAERFTSLIEEVDRLSGLVDLGEDASLAIYKAEYVSYTLIYRAIQAYHIDSASMPSTGVIEASQEAVKALRSIVLPPTQAAATSLSPPKVKAVPDLALRSGGGAGKVKVPLGRSTTTKSAAPPRPTRGTTRAVSEPKTGGTKATFSKSAATVKAKRRSSIAPLLVFDDLKKLTSLLGSLGSLLGLLGYTLQQIDVLKLLRAFQRNNEDLINDYVRRSAQLATEYQTLGKTSRAGFVFQQALRVVENGKKLVSPSVRVELSLRYVCHLAAKGETVKAQDAYLQAEALEKTIEPLNAGSYFLRVADRTEQIERGAWARKALAAIYVAQDNAAGAIMQLSAAFRLFSRASDVVCRIAAVYPDPNPTSLKAIAADDPFGAPPPKSEAKLQGADEPSKDSQTAPPSQTTHFGGKHLHAKQWHIASSLVSTCIDLATAFAYRGSVRDAEYFLKIAYGVAEAVRSQVLEARIGARQAELLFRMRKWEETGQKLESAAVSLNTVEGPDMVDLNRLKGDLYSRTEMVEEAGEVFESTSKEIAGLDAVFTAAEAIIPSVRASLTPSKTGQNGKEPLLPVVLAHVLRQHAWLLREAGSEEDCRLLLAQLRCLSSSTETKAEELLLEGRIALHEAFNTFKTDLFMSSLTESAVAMPMGNPTKRVIDRQSTRLSIQTVLTRAEEAFLSALSIASGSGKIEGIRQACLALALLKAFQTSLGHGSELVTASAADILASSSSITLQRELLEAIESKFVDVVNADTKWPLEPFELTVQDKEITQPEAMEIDGKEGQDLDDNDGRLRTYWDMVKSKYASRSLVSTESPSLETLPAEWAVISINVTDDHNTMFISRQQRDCDPIVFCLPLDRQGKREGEDEDDMWTFDAGVAELADIIKRSNETARNAKNLTDREDKIKWWEERHACDAKMKELCESMEFVWLGAFKTIFSPRIPSFQPIIDDFRQRLEKIFDSALSSASGGGGPLGLGQPRLSSKTHPKATTNRPSLSVSQVHLEDSLLQCFARLSSKAKDEEIEDLVYFILDVYQFHGVPVALAELDIDQIAIDVKGALEKIETRMAFAGLAAPKDEHIFLALDKNVSCLPWESIPVLRGRAVSRIPSLSFLLDQVAMSAHLRPSLTQSILQPSPQNQVDTRRTINARRTFYILNPGGDLKLTQGRFDPWLKEMVDKAGWKGIVGRPPTELELTAALKDYDLVVYIGHGGAEQYIRSHKVRHLPQCATTMLWGCSSGHLKDQGDFDRTGTAWNYMIAGCPSLTANLWDVTDADIDRLSLYVLKSLNLDAAHLPDSKSRPNTLLPLSEMSITQAVNAARDECKLKYLTGAAPVTYGVPVYLH
ncbi:hypothetical protein IAU59_005675 [Kwoniella sp. CBS 9459]